MSTIILHSFAMNKIIKDIKTKEKIMMQRERNIRGFWLFKRFYLRENVCEWGKVVEGQEEGRESVLSSELNPGLESQTLRP